MNTKQQTSALISALALSQDSLTEKAQKIGDKAMSLYQTAQTYIDTLRSISFTEDGETTTSLSDLYRLNTSIEKSMDLLQEIAAA